MTFNHYQEQAKKTAIFPNFVYDISFNSIEFTEQPSIKIIYPTLGLIGESAELYEKMHYFTIEASTTSVSEVHSKIILELSDVLWCISILADILGHKLSTVAQFRGEDNEELTFDSWIKDHIAFERHGANTIVDDLLYSTGLFAECVKKILRDQGGIIDKISGERLFEILHNCLVYIGTISVKINSTFNHIAIKNLEKLESRKERGVLNGSGDTR
jgi:hypothetical protein